MTTEEALMLVERVCLRLDINFRALRSKSRKRELVMQRRAFMYLLSDMDMTYKNIGKVFGKDHATVCASNVRHIEDLEIGYKDYKQIYESIKKEMIFKIHTVDSTIQTLLDIITAENALRHDALVDVTKSNRKLREEIEYLQNQIKIMIKRKNKKLNVFGKKVKISNEAYTLFEKLSEIIQLHEISMIGWVKNSYDQDNVRNEYEKEFFEYIMSIPNAKEMIEKMVLIDQELEQDLEKAKNVVEKKQSGEK